MTVFILEKFYLHPPGATSGLLWNERIYTLRKVKDLHDSRVPAAIYLVPGMPGVDQWKRII